MDQSRKARSNPIVQTLPIARTQLDKTAVEHGINPKKESTRKGLVRLLTPQFAELQIVVDGVPERLLELFHSGSLEGDHISKSNHFTVENLGIGIESHGPAISLVCHHGFTPASLKNRRTDRIAPRSVVGCGCGRWKTARTPFNATRTLEPLPSVTSAPSAWNKASTSF